MTADNAATAAFQCAVSRGPLVLVQLTLCFHSLYLMKALEMFPFGPQTRVKPNKPKKHVEILQVKMKTQFLVLSFTLSLVRGLLLHTFKL